MLWSEIENSFVVMLILKFVIGFDVRTEKSKNKFEQIITALLWFQIMYAGGSGDLSIIHVKLMVDPLSIYTSGAPIISVVGSVKKWREHSYTIHTQIWNIIKIFLNIHDKLMTVFEIGYFEKLNLFVFSKMRIFNLVHALIN